MEDSVLSPVVLANLGAAEEHRFWFVRKQRETLGVGLDGIEAVFPSGEAPE